MNDALSLLQSAVMHLLLDSRPPLILASAGKDSMSHYCVGV